MHAKHDENRWTDEKMPKSMILHALVANKVRNPTYFEPFL